MFNNFFFPTIGAVYEIRRKKYSTARKAINNNLGRCMRVACWVTKTTNTRRICNIHYISTATTDA